MWHKVFLSAAAAAAAAACIFSYCLIILLFRNCSVIGQVPKTEALTWWIRNFTVAEACPAMSKHPSVLSTSH